MHGNFSPDGRLIAYTSSESGKFEVNVETVPPSDKKSQVSTNGGYEPRWRADGRELYYLSEDHKQVIFGLSEFYRVFSLVNGGRARETDLLEGLR